MTLIIVCFLIYNQRLPWWAYAIAVTIWGIERYGNEGLFNETKDMICGFVAKQNEERFDELKMRLKDLDKRCDELKRKQEQWSDSLVLEQKQRFDELGQEQAKRFKDLERALDK